MAIPIACVELYCLSLTVFWFYGLVARVQFGAIQIIPPCPVSLRVHICQHYCVECILWCSVHSDAQCLSVHCLRCCCDAHCIVYCQMMSLLGSHCLVSTPEMTMALQVRFD